MNDLVPYLIKRAEGLAVWLFHWAKKHKLLCAGLLVAAVLLPPLLTTRLGRLLGFALSGLGLFNPIFSLLGLFLVWNSVAGGALGTGSTIIGGMGVGGLGNIGGAVPGGKQ